MSRMIFVNLPVTNLEASMAFYKALGFENNPHFSDATAACMVWSEAINVMLLTHDKWRTFTSRPIPPKTSSEVMLALSFTIPMRPTPSIVVGGIRIAPPSAAIALACASTSSTLR